VVGYVPRVPARGQALRPVAHPRRPREGGDGSPQPQGRHKGGGGPGRGGGAGRRRARTFVALVLLEALAASHPRRATGQGGSPGAVALARADSAFAAGSTRTAARNYGAVLAADPDNSRAVFRLAPLSRGAPALALQLFPRYVRLDTAAPWGYMAVGDVLARTGRYADALQWYDHALRLAPGERDAIVGGARVLARARRTDAAI